MAAVQSSAGQVTFNPLIDTVFNTDEPQRNNVLFRKYQGEALNEFQVVHTMFGAMPVPNVTYGHYEADWTHKSFTVEAVASPGAGLPVTVRVAAASVQTTTNTVYPRVRDVVTFPNGVTGTVISKTAAGAGLWDLVIEPQQTSFTIPALAANAQIIIGGNTFAEGTSQPEGRNTAKYLYEFSLQTQKETMDLTGDAITTKNWFETDSNGNPATERMAAEIDASYRMQLQLAYQMFWSNTTSNSAIGSTTMTGAVPYAESNGIVVPVSGSVVTTAAFDQLDRGLEKRNAASEYIVFAGPEMMRAFRNGSASIFSANPSLLARDAGNNFNSMFLQGGNGEIAAQAKQMGVNFNFTSLNMGTRVYHFVPCPSWAFDQLNNAAGTGQANRSKYGLVVPLSGGIDAKNNTPQARWKMRYKDYGGYSRMMKKWQTGANAPTPTSQTDVLQYNLLSQVGNQLFGIEQWGVLKLV